MVETENFKYKFEKYKQKMEFDRLKMTSQINSATSLSNSLGNRRQNHDI